MSGNININCPWCGDDPSHHLGIFVEERDGGGFACWRNQDHKGPGPKLVQKILKCDWEEACRIFGVNPNEVDLCDFDRLAQDPENIFNFKKKEMEKEEEKILLLPEHFKPIIDFGSCKEHFKYLMNRGFSKKQVQDVVRSYRLKYSMSESWVDRIIYPVYLNRELVTWTGRSIKRDPFIRYKSLSYRDKPDRKPDVPIAPMNIKHTLSNFDSLVSTGGKVLVITEGPFDFIKFDFFARPLDVRSTCLYSTAVLEEQIILLYELSSLFEKFVILLDKNEIINSLALQQKLYGLPTIIVSPPEGFDDPGDMTPQSIRTLSNELVSK